MSEPIYLDNAATTPIDERVIDSMSKLMREIHGNPSSIHSLGRIARNQIEQARKRIANHLGASIGEIFFTSGGTESNNMAIKCAVRDLGVKHIITSPTEHHCVLHTAERLQGQGIRVSLLDVDENGQPDLEQLEQLLKDTEMRTMVSLMHANNEIGTIVDVERISELCRENDALFHSDTVQTIAHFPINVSDTYYSFLSGSAHKFHGPKGVGFIYINNNNLIKPYVDGGSQERNMRGGTENIYGIVGMAEALDYAVAEMEARRKKITELRAYLKERLEATIEGIRFYGDQDHYLYTVLSVGFPPSENNDLLLMNLDIHGICASGGSACSSGSEKGSHVLEALNADPAYKTVRFSFSHFNTREELDTVVDQISEIFSLPITSE